MAIRFTNEWFNVDYKHAADVYGYKFNVFDRCEIETWKARETAARKIHNVEYYDGAPARRQERKLSATAVAALSKKQVRHRYSDGGSLYLSVKGTRSRWVYLFTSKGKTQEMGLRGYPAVSLDEARHQRDKWRAVLRQGNNPIEVRRNGCVLETIAAE